jgi:chemotaxis-related protein WspB
MLLLLFRVADQRYAVDASRVREVVPRVPVRALPHAPEWLAGLFDYRGRVVPAVDLGRLLGREACRRLLSTRIIVVDTGDANHKRRELLGLIAEQVSDVHAVDDARVVASPAAREQAPCLGAIVRDDDGLVQLIEAGRILAATVSDAFPLGPTQDAP